MDNMDPTREESGALSDDPGDALDSDMEMEESAVPFGDECSGTKHCYSHPTGMVVSIARVLNRRMGETRAS